MENFTYAISRSKQRIEENKYIKLVEEQAEWVKKQQNDFNYPLQYAVYKNELESDKNYIEKFKKLTEFESNFEFQWLPEAASDISPNEEVIEKRERWQKSLKKDFYIAEAVEILKDLSNSLQSKQILAQNKK